MKSAIIIHGMPDKEEYYSAEFPACSNYHWLPWLQKQLIMKDIKTDTPEMPHAYLPVYEVWKKEFERFDITPETVLVGHSCGGGFLVRWLSEHTEVTVGKVVLVAPYLDPENYIGNGFFDFEIDPQLASRTQGLILFHSTNDEDYIQKSVAKISVEIQNLKYVEFQNYGHFCVGDMKSEAFTDLLEEIMKT